VDEVDVRRPGLEHVRLVWDRLAVTVLEPWQVCIEILLFWKLRFSDF
jgi:hypothetical protein